MCYVKGVPLKLIKQTNKNRSTTSKLLTNNTNNKTAVKTKRFKICSEIR